MIEQCKLVPNSQSFVRRCGGRAKVACTWRASSRSGIRAMRPNCCSPDPEDENGVREEPVAIWSNKIRSGIRAVASAVEERNLHEDITIVTCDSLRKQAMQGPSRTRSLLLTGGVSLADPCAREDCARVYSSAGGVPRCPVRRVVMTQSGEAPSFKEVSIYSLITDVINIKMRP